MAVSFVPDVLRLRNYKCFGEQGTDLTIRPLTLLFGPNGAGKSALLRALVQLVEGVRVAPSHSPSESPLPMRVGDLSFGGSFGSLVHRQQPSVALGAGLDFSLDGVAWRWDFEVMEVNKDGKRRIQPCVWSLSQGSDVLEGVWPVGGQPACTFNDAEIVAEANIWPLTLSVLAGLPDDRPHWMSLLSSLPRLGDAVRHYGPFRPTPRSVFEVAGTLAADDARASTWERLAGSKQYGTDLLRQVSGWFDTHLGARLDVRLPQLDGEPRLFSIVVEDERGTKVNLHDTGAGFAQVLPLVVERYAPSAPVILVEQPELHLHPSAHADLGTLFVDLANEPGRRVVVETHSENLLLRVRRHIAQGVIAPEDVAIYWVHSVDGFEAEARRLHVDADGWIEDWPYGVFAEDAHEAEALVAEQRARRAQDAAPS